MKNTGPFIFNIRIFDEISIPLLRIFLIANFAFLLSNGVMSQDYVANKQQPDSRTLIKTNPAAMIQGPIFFCSEFRFCAERVIRSSQSIQFSASYLGKSYWLVLSEALQDDPYRFVVKGFRVTAEYRVYPGFFNKDQKAPEGPYVAPYISWASAQVSDHYSVNFNEYTKATYQNICIKTGYQFIKGSFVMDFFFGMGYRNNVWTMHENHQLTILDSQDTELFPGHLKLLCGFNAGICF